MTFSDPGAIEAQAREWLVRMDSDAPLSAREREALEEWLGRSAAHRAELKRLSRFWSSANVLTDLAVPVRQRRNPTSRNAGFALAAAFAMAVMGSLVWWVMQSKPINSGTHGTAVGQQQLLTLADGSSVQLNTDSRIEVRYRENLREIRLLRGEALFTVAPDASRPFEVHAADGVVRAVGTAFSVHLDGALVRVVVTHGRVDVIDAHASKPFVRIGSLVAGEITTFGDNARPEIEVQRLAEPELERRLAWHEGYLVFSGEPLGEVVKQVNRYSPRRLEVTDARLANLAIGGRFKIGDLDAVLDVLHSSFGIEATASADGGILLEHARAPL